MKKITMQKKEFLRMLNEHIITENEGLIKSITTEIYSDDNANKTTLEKLQIIFNRVLFTKISVNKIPCLLFEKDGSQYKIMLINKNDYEEHKEKYNEFITDNNVDYDKFSTYLCDNFHLLNNASIGIKIDNTGKEIDNLCLFVDNLEEYNIDIYDFYQCLFIITYILFYTVIGIESDKIYTIVNNYAIYKENEIDIKSLIQNNKNLLNNSCLYYFYDDDDFNYKTVVIEIENKQDINVYSPDDYER